MRQNYRNTNYVGRGPVMLGLIFSGLVVTLVDKDDGPDGPEIVTNCGISGIVIVKYSGFKFCLK